MPTTNSSTVGTSSTYATLTLFQVGRVKNCVSADVIERAVMKKELHTAQFSFNNATWVTDATRYVWIDVDVADRHKGIQAAGARLITTINTHCISVSRPEFIHITGLELSTTVSPAQGSGIGLFVSGSDTSCDKLMMHGWTGSNGRGFWLANVGIDLLLINSFMFNLERAGIEADSRSNTATIKAYNNTVWDVGKGGPGFLTDCWILVFADATDLDIDQRNNLLHAENEVFINRLATPEDAWSSNTDQNILSDATGTVENLPGDMIESVTFQAGTGGSGDRVMFVSLTGGSEDFHILQNIFNLALNYGNNLAAVTVPTNISLVKDINEDVRPINWDAGAHQISLPILQSLKDANGSMYPSRFDAFLPVNDVGHYHVEADYSLLVGAVLAIQKELGLDIAGNAGTLATRLYGQGNIKETGTQVGFDRIKHGWASVAIHQMQESPPDSSVNFPAITFTGVETAWGDGLPIFFPRIGKLAAGGWSAVGTGPWRAVHVDDEGRQTNNISITARRVDGGAVPTVDATLIDIGWLAINFKFPS